MCRISKPKVGAVLSIINRKRLRASYSVIFGKHTCIKDMHIIQISFAIVASIDNQMPAHGCHCMLPSCTRIWFSECFDGLPCHWRKMQHLEVWQMCTAVVPSEHVHALVNNHSTVAPSWWGRNSEVVRWGPCHCVQVKEPCLIQMPYTRAVASENNHVVGIFSYTGGVVGEWSWHSAFLLLRLWPLTRI